MHEILTTPKKLCAVDPNGGEKGGKNGAESIHQANVLSQKTGEHNRLLTRPPPVVFPFVVISGLLILTITFMLVPFDRRKIPSCSPRGSSSTS